MTNKDLVSIIVPVYNAEKSLKACVESILKQTYKNIEVILINDGSEDNSGYICEEYTRNDERVKVIHQSNSGPSSARNTGINNARGKYIQFVDSDDSIEHNMTERLVQQIENDKSQIVICGYNIVQNSNGDEQIIKRNPKIYGIHHKSDFLKKFGRLYFNGFINSPWNKLYNVEIIRKFNIRFPEDINIGEDLLFNLDYIKYCDKISIINESLYNYVNLHYSSLTKSYKESYFKTQKFLHQKVNEFLKDYNIYNDENKIFVEQVYSYRIIECIENLFHNNSELSFKYKKSEIEEIISDVTVRENLLYFKNKRILERLVFLLIRKKSVNIIFLLFKLKFVLKNNLKPLFVLLKKLCKN